jgi:hypothetical protein
MHVHKTHLALVDGLPWQGLGHLSHLADRDSLYRTETAEQRTADKDGQTHAGRQGAQGREGSDRLVGT